MASIVAENVAMYLGGVDVLEREVCSDFDLAELVQENLPVASVDRVMTAELIDSQELYDLVVPRRTLTKRRSTTGRLTTEESDRLVRIVRVIVQAVQAFDEFEKAREWLRRPNRSLDSRRPIDLLTTDNGSRLVETILGRIEYGVYS